MASIIPLFRLDGTPVWDVRYRVDGRQKAKRFTDLPAAKKFAADTPRGRRGRATRTASDLVGHILRKSRIDERGCWVWTGNLSNVGYGKLTWKGATPGPIERGAHRVSYVVMVGPMAPGLVIDHLCRNRACVNPDHLEPVAQRENVLRSPIAQGALNARKTHCVRGHAYTPENTKVVVNPGGRKCTERVCRTCVSMRRTAKAVSA